MSFLRVFCRIRCPSDSNTEPKRRLLESIFREQYRNKKRCLDCAGVDGMHWAHPVERSGGFKIRRKVNCEQNVPGKLKGARKTQKHEARWGQDGRQGRGFFYLFLPGWPHARRQGRRDLKNLLLVHRITKILPPELQKWAQEYPKWNLNLKSESKSWWGAFL